MAIGTPVLVSNAGASDDIFTTAAFTPAADSNIFVSIFARDTVAISNEYTISDSLGLTWTEIASFEGGASSPFVRMAVFWARSTNTNMTVTVENPGVAQISATVVTVPMSTAPVLSNVDTSDGTGTGETSCTLTGSPAAAIMFATNSANGSYAQASGYTEILDAVPTGLTNIQRTCVAYDLTSPSATCTMTNATSSKQLGIMFELLEGGGAITGVRFNNTNTFHTAVVGRGAVNIAHADFTNTSVFHTAVITTSALNITGVRYNDPDTFHTAVVTRGAVGITGVRFDNVADFGSNLITQDGAENQDIIGNHFANVATFPAATIEPGAVDVQGTLFENVSVFGSNTVSNAGAGILAALFENQTVFHSARLNDESLRLGVFQARAYMNLGQFRFAVLQTRPEFPQPLLASPYMWYSWQLDAFMSQYPDYATTLALPEDWPINQE